MGGLQIMILTLLVANSVAASVVLTSDPSSASGSFCRGPVLFTCRATEASIVFDWQLNNSTISSYTFDSLHNYPRSETVNPPASDFGVAINITNATNIGLGIDITSTLHVPDVSRLNGSSLHCQDRLGTSSKRVVVFSPSHPPPATPHCTISGSLMVSLLFSTPFNLQYHVERYHVAVTPDPTSCSSDLVPPREDYIYNCSGLELGTNYSITVSAINCGDQEGENNNYSFQLGAPTDPENLAVVNSVLGNTLVEWSNVVPSSFSMGCTLDPIISYTVRLEASSGGITAERMLTSDACSAGICSITFPSSDQYCRVSIRASSVFGESNRVYALDPPPPKISKVVAIYSGDPSTLKRIQVTWTNSTIGAFNCENVPIIITEDSFGGRTHSLAGGKHCDSSSTCFAVFHISVLEESYILYLGNTRQRASPVQYEIFGSSQQLLRYTLTEWSGMVFAKCSSLVEGIDYCTIQYGMDHSYDNLSSPVTGPMDTLFHICVLELTPAVYYHQGSVIINSTLEIRVRSSTAFSFSNNNTYTCTSDAESTYDGIILQAYQMGLLGAFICVMVLALVICIGLLIHNCCKGKRCKSRNLEVDTCSRGSVYTSNPQTLLRETSSSYQDVNPTNKCCKDPIKDDASDSVVYDEIPGCMLRLNNSTAAAPATKSTGLNTIQLTTNSAYRKGMYSNVNTAASLETM